MRKQFFLALLLFIAPASVRAMPLEQPTLNPANGHYYQLRDATPRSKFPFEDAVAESAKLSFHGMSGYLATVTSESEQQFLVDAFDAFPNGATPWIWIGGSDAAVDGEWRWVTGPEAGQLFWKGDSKGAPLGYEAWDRDDAGKLYEPNNNQGPHSENYLAMETRRKNGTWPRAIWNDINNTTHGSTPYIYLVEYSPVPGDINGDGAVDLQDFGILKANFGSGTTRSEGDFDGDGQVDLFDFGILKENFAKQGPPPPPSPPPSCSQPWLGSGCWRSGGGRRPVLAPLAIREIGPPLGGIGRSASQARPWGGFFSVCECPSGRS